ncbi:hypothetical protein B0A48_15684 [Cryoendolithus antarcticus]|uniref:chitinase n=1 Tax=Cryoendolithus antarcticus TaxID=1507870 RepID=A0A1V8SGZ8_9PEZI|nr:hypothetical protein B0A48_15684 [Cryoendolithus antarcticus]
MNRPNPPLLPIGQGPRVIVYHQTHHKPDGGPPVSLLPLVTENTGITHVIVAAIHLNDPPGNITLNDDDPETQKDKYATLFGEMAWLQQAFGVKVMAMLGGAAKGSYQRLDGDDVARFEAYYTPLRDLLRKHLFDGLDLDVEEETSLPGITRLIDRLRLDFGPSFIITLAPVANALLPNQPHLSGFNYQLLEQIRGHEIAWYNAQFYCGWGDASSTAWYDAIVGLGWPANKVVIGLITNFANGAGHVAWPQLEQVLRTLRQRYPTFGGVMGWEYFNALPGGVDRPWEWVANMGRVLRTPLPPAPFQPQIPIRPYGQPATQPLPPAPHAFPAESVKTLQDLGFSHQQAIAALNMTSGNVEYAAGLLFQD